MDCYKATLGLALFLLCASASALPIPAIQFIQGPPPGNYCSSKTAPALFNIHLDAHGPYSGQGTFSVNHQVVFVSARGPLGMFPEGFYSGTYPLPPNVVPPPSYPAGTLFTTRSVYFDAAQKPTYANELTIRCDTGETISIFNIDLTLSALPVPVSPFPAGLAVACVVLVFWRRLTAIPR